MKKFTHEELVEDAKKYRYRSDWDKHSPHKYRAALRRGIAKECCAHMEYKTNPYKDDIGVIYGFFFSDNSVYIGLTIQPEERFKNHQKNGTVFNKIQKGFTYEYKILETKIPNSILADKENAYIDLYKNHPSYTLLNKTSGGSRGGINQITNKQIFESASKYKTKAEWYNSETSFYRLAKKRGIMNIATAHMQKGNTRWTTELLIADAKKYSSRSEWENNSASAYNSARSRNLLTECCGHMQYLRQEWTDDELLAEALKYKTISEWLKHSRKSYSVARGHGIFEKCCAHMKRMRKTWTYDNILTDCKRFSSKKEWRAKSQCGYEAAYKNGILEECVRLLLSQKLDANKIQDEDDALIIS